MDAPAHGPNATTDGSVEPPESWLRSLAALLGPGGARASVWIASGTVVDGAYRIERPLGAGGMAVIYLARDLELDRLLALKVYDIDARELSLSRIYREARAMAKLSHPNVLVVHGVGVHEQRVFLAMEYVEGNTLRGWLADERPPWSHIVAMFAACARGLAAAHAVGIVHGDFKPDNVLVGRDGRPRVADFGLARMIDTAHDRSARSGDATGDATDGFAGTPRYAAPEQHEGASADERADQFAFCVALYEALYRVHPFAGDDTDAQVEAVRAGRLRSRPMGSAVPRRLQRVLARGLAADPEGRFASIEELVIALERDPWRRRTRVGGAAIVVASGLALAWPRVATCERSDAAIDELWNAARAGSIGEVFASSGSPVHAEAHRDLVERVDGWVGAWRQERRDACEATHERREQSDAMLDRRMLCLDRQLGRLGVALETLDRADREVVASAADLVAELPAPRQCADLERLFAGVAPPDDALLSARVEDERRELAHGRVAIELGRYAEAAERAEAVRTGEAARDYPPLGAAASLVLGVARWRAFENTAGENALTEAFHVATASGDDEVATIAARELVCNLSQVVDSEERSAWWSRVAESTGDRGHAGEAERLELQACRGLALHSSGDYVGAEAVYRDALARTDALADPESLLPAQLHDRLGATLFALARPEEARQEHQLAYDEARALRGAAHPLVVSARSNLATALTRLERRGDALAIYLDVLQSFIALYGPDSARLVGEYQKVASVLVEIGALPQAMAYRERGIAIARARGDQGRVLAALLISQADDLAATGQIELAVELGVEAIRVSEAHLGAEHPDTGKAHVNRGANLAKIDRYEEAEAEFESALAILAPALGEMHPSLGIVHLNLASLAQYRGRLDEFEAALDTAERIADANSDDRLRLYVALTRPDGPRSRGDLRRSSELTRSALELAKKVDPIAERATAFQLAEDELALGDAEAAQRSFERSRELSVAQGATSRVAASEFGMARASWAMGKRRDARRFAQTALATFAELDEPVGVERCETWLKKHR